MKNSQQGSVMILVTLGITAFIGLTALVLDAGNWYLTKDHLQKAVDAAALAAAQELPARPAQATQQALQTLTANQNASANPTVTYNASNTKVQVSASEPGRSLLAAVLGFGDQTLSATAAVQLNPITSATGIIPLGVDSSIPLSYGDEVTLKAGTSDYGNFGALNLSGPGASRYRDDLANGYSTTVSVGDVLDTQTGNLVGPTIQGINDRMARCSNPGSVTYYDYPPNYPLVVLVPVYQPLQSNGNQVKQVQIVGFATFFIESVGSPSDSAVVTGRFIQRSTSGASSASIGDYGTYGYKLVQ